MKGLFFTLILLLGWQVQAQSLLQIAEEQFFNPRLAARVGIEVELAGLTVDQTAEVLQKVLGGKIEINLVDESYIDRKTGKEVTYVVTEKILVGSRIGDVKIKPEDNNLTTDNLKEQVKRTPLIEIVSAPLTFDKVQFLQEAVDELHRKGALGAADGFAVAIQVNVEIGEGQREKMRVEEVIDLMRNYLKPEHREGIAAELGVVDQRRQYLGDYTPGMMQRILDLNYKPTWQQFYVDFMYRQSLELLGYKEAWTMSEAKARRLLQQELAEKGFESILRVVKWNYLRVSSLLMFMQPQDWLSRYLIKTTWFHDYTIVEFREANSDFNILGRVKQFLGLVQKSQQVGDFTYVASESVPLRIPAGFRCVDVFAL